ncbi:hypothetical protein TorRG33x02_110110, partial [Trema orientale]
IRRKKKKAEHSRALKPQKQLLLTGLPNFLIKFYNLFIFAGEEDFHIPIYFFLYSMLCD